MIRENMLYSMFLKISRQKFGGLFFFAVHLQRLPTTMLVIAA
jgi:hypothetical protein